MCFRCMVYKFFEFGTMYVLESLHMQVCLCVSAHNQESGVVKGMIKRIKLCFPPEDFYIIIVLAAENPMACGGKASKGANVGHPLQGP